MRRKRTKTIECVRSCDQQPYLFIKTKENFFIKKEFNSHRIYILLQYGRLNIVCSSNMAGKSHSAIRQKEVGHLMMLTQRSILNRDSTDVDKNKAEN